MSRCCLLLLTVGAGFRVLVKYFHIENFILLGNGFIITGKYFFDCSGNFSFIDIVLVVSVDMAMFSMDMEHVLVDG